MVSLCSFWVVSHDENIEAFGTFETFFFFSFSSFILKGEICGMDLNMAKSVKPHYLKAQSN